MPELHTCAYLTWFSIAFFRCHICWQSCHRMYYILRIFLSRTLTAIKPNRKWGKTKNANSRVSFCRFSCVLFVSGLPRLSEMGMAVLARLWRCMYILKRFIPRSFAADVSKLSAQMAPNGDTCCTSIAANRVDI